MWRYDARMDWNRPYRSAAISAAFVSIAALASCKSSNTTNGLLDIDGKARPVVELQDPEDRARVQRLLAQIEDRTQAMTLAKQREDRLQAMQKAGRASDANILDSAIATARAREAVLEARIALAASGLLPPGVPTFLDTDDDGHPDLVLDPSRIPELRAKKTEALQTVHKACKTLHANTAQLAKAGRASAADLSAAELRMLRAEEALLKARREQAAERD